MQKTKQNLYHDAALLQEDWVIIRAFHLLEQGVAPHQCFHWFFHLVNARISSGFHQPVVEFFQQLASLMFHGVHWSISYYWSSSVSDASAHTGHFYHFAVPEATSLPPYWPSGGVRSGLLEVSNLFCSSCCVAPCVPAHVQVDGQIHSSTEWKVLIQTRSACCQVCFALVWRIDHPWYTNVCCVQSARRLLLCDRATRASEGGGGGGCDVKHHPLCCSSNVAAAAP